jgi:hypothetical protein
MGNYRQCDAIISPDYRCCNRASFTSEDGVNLCGIHVPTSERSPKGPVVVGTRRVITVRMQDEIYDRAVLAAKTAGLSLNLFVVKLIEDATQQGKENA